jgi:hypothetical protein
MGLSYSEIKQLTAEEELFFIQSYKYLNDKKYGTSQKKNKTGIIKSTGNSSDYKRELEQLKGKRTKIKNDN